MKRRTSIMIALALLALAACGGKAKDTGTAAAKNAAEPGFVMQIGHGQATTSPRHVSTESFKAAVEKRTNGGVKVEIFPAGQLGSEQQMTEQVVLGTLQGVRGGDRVYQPESMMLSMPFLADNLEQARALCYSDFTASMMLSCEKEYGLKVLAVGDDSGFRQITNNTRPIKTVADMKGIKMRTTLPIITDSLEAFGSSTVSIPFTELYMALKTGVADGQENPLALITNQKFYEVQKYCTVIDYMFFVEPFYVNLAWFNTLPAEYQQILAEESRNMMDETTRICDRDNAVYLETIAKNGCQVYHLTPEERETFRPAAETVWKKWIAEGKMTRQDLDAMLKITGKTVNW